MAAQGPFPVACLGSAGAGCVGLHQLRRRPWASLLPPPAGAASGVPLVSHRRFISETSGPCFGVVLITQVCQRPSVLPQEQRQAGRLAAAAPGERGRAAASSSGGPGSGQTAAGLGSPRLAAAPPSPVSGRHLAGGGGAVPGRARATAGFRCPSKSWRWLLPSRPGVPGGAGRFTAGGRALGPCVACCSGSAPGRVSSS